MRWIAVTGWALAAMFAVLWVAAGPCGGPVLRDPEADLLRDRVRALEAERAERDGGPGPGASTHPPLVDPAATAGAPEKAGPGRFVVKVLSAKGLRDTDGLGKADPFVVVAYDGEERLTPVARSTLSPVWNQEFEFRYVAGQHLTLTVLDRDVISHDLVGRASLVPDPGEAGRRDLALSGGGTLGVEIRFSE